MAGKDAMGNVNANQGGIPRKKETRHVLKSVGMVLLERVKNVTVGRDAMMIVSVVLDCIQMDHHPAIQYVVMAFLHLMRIAR